MKSLSAIWKFATGKDPDPPSPYKIALRLAGSLLASGRYADDPGAAMDQAWNLVLAFYQGQRAYSLQVTALFDMSQHASPVEGDMSRAEARAYVAGEANPAEPLAAVTVHVPKADAAYWERVNAAAEKVQEARRDLDVAMAAGDETRIASARQAFDQAAAEQSKVYL
jgi:hypothetical protein